MSVNTLIRDRFSVRSYLPDPISKDDLMKILEAAQYSQSAKNLQDWRFIVVQNKDSRERLVEAAKGQRFVGEAPVVIACCGVGTEYIMTCGQHSYTIDVSIAMENMALTAHELGLGTCWLGAFYEDKVKNELKIPLDVDVRVVGLLTVGKARGVNPEKRRKEISEIICYEEWSQD